MRREPDGSLVTHAELAGLSEHPWKELVVDGRGNAYTNSICFDMMGGGEFSPGIVALVTPDGAVRQVADDIHFPNGMAVTPDNDTLIVAEGGEVLQTMELDRSCFACMLGGTDGTTLFMMAAQWNGPEGMTGDTRTGQVLTVEAPAPHAGRP